MTGDARYRRHQVVEVDAAVVGVSRQRWESADQIDVDEAKRKMEDAGFDLLPVDSPGKPVSRYYRTVEWNDFNAVHLAELTPSDRIAYTTPIREVVRRFAAEPERRFFFLDDEDGNITGLLTVANLNCSQARIWLYALVVELEVTLANFLQAQHVDSDESALLRLVPAQAVGQRVKDRLDGMDRELVEYLYLSNLVNVIAKQKLFDALGYPTRGKFEDAFGRLNAIRHLVAHPVRSLVEEPDDVGRLWETVHTAETALEHLDLYRPWSPDARQ